MIQKRRKNQREVGAVYEKTAGEYLKANGYTILEYNFRCRMGEIDIIAKDGEVLVFCEVKYRANQGAGHPLEAIDLRKQRVITKCAMYYLTVRHCFHCPCRFDVVSVEGEKITLIKNAFEAAE